MSDDQKEEQSEEVWGSEKKGGQDSQWDDDIDDNSDQWRSKTDADTGSDD